MPSLIGGQHTYDTLHDRTSTAGIINNPFYIDKQIEEKK